MQICGGIWILRRRALLNGGGRGAWHQLMMAPTASTGGTRGREQVVCLLEQPQATQTRRPLARPRARLGNVS